MRSSTPRNQAPKESHQDSLAQDMDHKSQTIAHQEVALIKRVQQEISIMKWDSGNKVTYHDLEYFFESVIFEETMHDLCSDDGEKIYLYKSVQ